VGSDALVRTREAWHAVAEHVLGAALYAATGHIGLRAAPGGFATPPFAPPGPATGGSRRIRVDGVRLVVEDDRGSRAEPLTTLRAAGALAGVEPGAPPVYTAATPLDLDVPLPVDPAAATALADWYQVVDDALARLCRATAAEGPATVQLWPEHFDLATRISEVNFGGSPGDAGHDQPYLYAGPSAVPGGDGFWNEPFGASRGEAQVGTADDAVAFFAQARSLLGAPVDLA
jgi:hypothetical protein